MAFAVSLMLAVPSAQDAVGWYERALGAQRLWDVGSAPWGVHRQGGFTDPFLHRWLVGDKSPLEPWPGG